MPRPTLPAGVTGVLVTGANGFVGGRVCARLAGLGAEVRAQVRRPDAQLHGVPDDVVRVVARLDEASALAVAMDGVSHVVHCAAGVGPELDEARAVNVDGTRTVLAAAATAGVRHVVHVSTTSVVHADAVLVDESSPLVEDDASPYAVTKRDAEAVVAAHSGSVGQPTATVLRPPAVLGWSPTSTWGERVPTLVDRGELWMKPDPRAGMGWVHVDDLADAVVLALDADVAAGRLFTVVGGTTTWGSYLTEVGGWFGGRDDLFEHAEDAPPPRTWSAAALTAALGWEPQVGLAEAMAEAAAHHGG